MTGWRLLLLTTTVIVATDHTAALRRLGIGPRRFTAEVMASSRTVVTEILAPRPREWS